jgi:hypothetical protein
MKFKKNASKKMKSYLLVTSLLMTALSMPTLANFLNVFQNQVPVAAKPKPVVKPPIGAIVVKSLAKKKAKKGAKKPKVVVVKDSISSDLDPTKTNSPLYENN